MSTEEIIKQIIELKREKNAVILAHFYQDAAIQEVADFVGDSYNLSVKASKTTADIIVFAGVRFMAETAKILNPTKKVILPDITAGCSLEDSCEYDQFKAFISRHPEHKVVTYINCSAKIKSLSNVICTSSNAEKIINSIPISEEIIFAPDRNLGRYLSDLTGRKMTLWDGACIVHEAFSLDKLMALMWQNREAELLAHPESTQEVLGLAHFIGSTSAMIQYVSESPKSKFIVATEAGILFKMQEAVPTKVLIPVPTNDNNECACSECAFMKVNTLEKLLTCLRTETPEITLPYELLSKALLPLKQMIKITENEN